MKLHGVFLLLFVTLPVALTGPTNREEGDTSLGRLPTDLWPIHYVLELQPDFYDEEPPFYFNGSVMITFEVRNPTSIIYLNSRDLVIDESSLYVVMDPSTPVPGPDPVWLRSEYDEELQFYKIFLEDDLLDGAIYQMGMNFSGEILPPSDQYGLFYTTYRSIIDGSLKYQVATQMQWAGGRRVFPHFDEPMFKATFETTLVRKSHVVALSNGNLLSSEDRGDGWIADKFNTTVKMSSYLNCLVIGDFAYLDAPSESGMPIRVWARPEYVQDLEFAQSQVGGIHDYFLQFTGIADPMPKLDHIAIPEFSLGAMENWGLVPYGEPYLLYNESTDTLRDQRLISSIIGHETSHLWFGNLVTLRWWTDLWLNEGVASYFEDMAFDTVWGMPAFEEGVKSKIKPMLDQDDSNTTQPVRKLVESPWDHPYTFTTYGKGSAVIRMLRQILGADTFQRAWRLYLNRFAYDNAETDDLWQAMTDQAEIDGVLDTDGTKLFIKEKMDPWIDQRGYPLITLRRTAPGIVDATQNIFHSPKDQTMPISPFMYEWYVPLTITNEEALNWTTETKDWLDRENKTITSGIPNSMDQWFIANIEQAGFFRVQYDNNTYFQIVDQLDNDASIVPNMTRFAILNDAFAITRAGLDTEVHAMEATRFLDQENNFVVWDTADKALAYTSLMLARYPTTYSVFQEYLRSKVDPAYVRFGWDNTGSNNFERAARAVVIELACNYGNPDCETEARSRFDTFIADPSVNTIAVDLRVPVYCTSIRNGNQQDWNALHAYYLNIQGSLLRNTQSEVDRVLASLACSEDDSVLERYINMTYDRNLIKLVDTEIALEAIAGSSRGRWVLWNHFTATWNSDPVPPGADKWGPFMTIIEGFANDEDVSQLESFIARYPPQNDFETVRYDMASKTVNENSKWATDNQSDLEQWLQSHTEGKVVKTSPVGSNHGLRERLSRISDVKQRGKLSNFYNQYSHLI